MLNETRSQLLFFSRFNVALTRSKALMIVVGNPKILWLDPHWKELVQRCILKGK